MTTTLQEFIESQKSLVERREVEAAIASWEAGMNATAENESRAAICQAELDACYADSGRFQTLTAFPEPHDHDLRRQKRLLVDEFTKNQMPRVVIEEIARREMEIDGIFANYRANLGGRLVSDNDLRAVLRSSSDSAERQAAWEAGKQIGGQVAGKLLELIAIRNREARRQGYEDYYAMSISLQELEEEQLFETLEQVSRDTEQAFLEAKSQFDADLAKRFHIGTADLRPWHYSDPFFQEAPIEDESRLDALFEGRKLEDILIDFYDAIGLDIRGLLPFADLYEKPGKNQHAYCLSVGRGTGDIRVNCNLRPDVKWMGTLLHEFGHAVYDNELGSDLPFFLKTVSHIMTTEAIAELMGRFVTNAAWLKRWIDTPAARADTLAESATRIQRTQLLVFTQWVLVIARFERELYRNPERDLGALWWELVAKYQHITPPNNAAPDAWASKIHLSTSPVYYHNYLFGEMIASQLLHTLRTKIVASEDELVSSPKVGRFLLERFFRPGARYAWNDLVDYATGEPLNTRYIVDELRG